MDAAPDGLHPGRGQAGGTTRRTRTARSAALPARPDEDGLIVARGELVYAVLNLYPYNPGHLMVVPYRHVADYTELDAGRDRRARARSPSGRCAALRAAIGAARASTSA